MAGYQLDQRPRKEEHVALQLRLSTGAKHVRKELVEEENPMTFKGMWLGNFESHVKGNES